MTPADITTWRNSLPMADLGTASKRIYRAISDCNKVKMDPKERFEILELFRPLIQFVCQSLSKHYINQTGSLTAQQLTIANLAQTLQTEMADGYKLLVEQNNQTNDLKPDTLSIILQRIVHYFTHIILRNYHLYSVSPPKIWKELYLLHQLAEKKQLLKQNNLIDEYKRLLLLAGAFPYQWRQTEQEALYKATEIWAKLASFRDNLPNETDPGYLVIDFSDDHPPASPARKLAEFSNTCKVLDVNKILERIKTLLVEIEPNELKAKIVHSNDPEYGISTAMLRGLLKEWGTPIARFEERTPCKEPIKICVGLSNTHYYLNEEKPFQAQQVSEESDHLSLSLPTLGIQEESINIAEIDLGSSPLINSEKTNQYPLYACTIVDETTTGYGLIWQEKAYPPMQAGEVIGITLQSNTLHTFELGVVRWLQRHADQQFKLGVERLAKTAKAAAAQLIKEGQPAGYFLRCLMLESSILLPTLPFKSGSHVSVLQGNTAVTFEIDLTKLIDSTGSYKRFEFLLKTEEVKTSTPSANDTPSLPTNASVEEKKEDDAFDSIWKDL